MFDPVSGFIHNSELASSHSCKFAVCTHVTMKVASQSGVSKKNDKRLKVLEHLMMTTLVLGNFSCDTIAPILDDNVITS